MNLSGAEDKTRISNFTLIAIAVKTSWVNRTNKASF